MGPVQKVSEDTLKVFYASAKKDLIPFTENVRSKPKCSYSPKELENIFNNSVLWTAMATKNGHANYQSTLLPAVHIGFLKHSKDDVYGDHLKNILEGVQKVLNFMGNDIFKLGFKRWNGKEPDFKQALNQYNETFAKEKKYSK